MKDNQNPFLPDTIIDQLPQSKRMLTQLQSFAFPILIWFFDKNTNRAQGRTVLMAHIHINLAIRNGKSKLIDYSVGTDYISTFPRVVKQIVDEHYKKYKFNYKHSTNEIEFVGIKPK